jgi:pimeloyl-ACP methyl ester carboxylesterase
MKRLLLVLLLSGCIGKASIGEPKIMDFKIKTSDGVKIAGTFYESKADNPAGIVLLHMLNRDRRDWDSFARALQASGYAVVAIDLRGHGDSDLDWRDFADKDFRKMVEDVDVAVKYLKKQGIASDKISLIGASIGANVALEYASQNGNVRSLVLLSPGVDYRGLRADEAIEEYDGPVLIVASEEDVYSTQSSQILFEKAVGEKKLEVLKNAGHGTKMFSDPNLGYLILRWLEDTAS